MIKLSARTPPGSTERARCSNPRPSQAAQSASAVAMARSSQTAPGPAGGIRTRSPMTSETRETGGPRVRDDEAMDLDADASYRAIATRDARFDGRVFVAVKSTGIYCRPICPARTPKRETLVFYPSAAAAQEAGYRPCLRCRPESAPDLGVWRGTSNTVSRAVALIEKGGLDGADVEALADRLGVGERQLRRLFRRHLGASPIAVAQTRRGRPAQPLIHRTPLPQSGGAPAARFGRLPRCNRNLSQPLRPAAARVRPDRRPGGDRRAPVRGFAPGSFGGGATGPARGRRMGRVRARGARPARSADHGGRRRHARGPPGGGLWQAAGRRRRGA